MRPWKRYSGLLLILLSPLAFAVEIPMDSPGYRLHRCEVSPMEYPDRRANHTIYIWSHNNEVNRIHINTDPNLKAHRGLFYVKENVGFPAVEVNYPALQSFDLVRNTTDLRRIWWAYQEEVSFTRGRNNGRDQVLIQIDMTDLTEKKLFARNSFEAPVRSDQLQIEVEAHGFIRLHCQFVPATQVRTTIPEAARTPRLEANRAEEIPSSSASSRATPGSRRGR